MYMIYTIRYNYVNKQLTKLNKHHHHRRGFAVDEFLSSSTIISCCYIGFSIQLYTLNIYLPSIDRKEHK